MRELFTPPRAVTLSMTGAEVDVVDDQSRKLAIMTDGRKLQKSKDDSYQEIAAHWDGTRLVTDEKNPRGGKMSRTYELSYDGTQLYETLHMTVGRNNTPLVIRFVYDQAPGANSSPAPAAPQHPSTTQQHSNATEPPSQAFAGIGCLRDRATYAAQFLAHHGCRELTCR